MRSNDVAYGTECAMPRYLLVKAHLPRHFHGKHIAGKGYPLLNLVGMYHRQYGNKHGRGTPPIVRRQTGIVLAVEEIVGNAVILTEAVHGLIQQCEPIMQLVMPPESLQYDNRIFESIHVDAVYRPI